MSDQILRAELDKVLKTEMDVSRGENIMSNEHFNVKKVKSYWLSTKYKQFYYLQVESKGEVEVNRSRRK